MDLSDTHAPYPTVLVLECSWFEDVHKQSFYFWTVEINCMAYHITILVWQGLSSSIPLGFFYQVYYRLGGSDRNNTSLAQVWTEFSVRICFYHSILSPLFWNLSWSKRIPNPKYMQLRYFCCFPCTFKRFSGKKYLLFSTLTIENNLFARHWDSIVLGLYLLTTIYGNLLRVSDTMLSYWDICWILIPK